MGFEIVAAARSGDVADLVLAIVIAVGVAAYFVYRSNRKKRARDAKAGRGEFAPVPPGYVRIVYHTYSGFLVFTIQRRREVTLTPDAARKELGDALRHNLTWGLFAYGFLVIPILSLMEHRTQMKKVSAAAQRGFPVARSAPSRRA